MSILSHTSKNPGLALPLSNTWSLITIPAIVLKRTKKYETIVAARVLLKRELTAKESEISPNPHRKNNKR
jgi:hypothetical protein